MNLKLIHKLGKKLNNFILIKVLLIKNSIISVIFIISNSDNQWSLVVMARND